MSKHRTFKVGDRVRYIKDNDTDVRYGEIGTICDLDYFGFVGVEWERPDPERHTCEGKCVDWHGWYINPSWIGLLDDGDDPLRELQTLDLEDLFV